MPLATRSIKYGCEVTMDVSAGANADVNLKTNLGALLQMLKATGSDYSTATKEGNADNVGNDAENGNNFLQILQQKIAVLLQSGESESSQEKTTKEDISKALEKMLEGDGSAAGDLLSGLSLLAIGGDTKRFINDESELPEKSFSGLITASEMTCISKEEITAYADQAKMGMAKNEKKISDSITLELPADKNVVQPNGVSEPDTKTQTIDMPLQSQTASFSITLELPADKNVAQPNGVSEPATKTQTIDMPFQSQTASFNGSIPPRIQDPGDFGNSDMDPATGKPYVTSGISGPGVFGHSDIDPMTGKPRTEGISVTEKMLGENQNIKADANNEEVVLANKGRLITANGAQNSQEQTGEDFKKIMSAKPDASFADTETAPPINDAQKNIAGKVAASTPESAGMIDKIKTDFKSKTVPGDHNLESNVLSSSMVSGDRSTKIAANDVSPAQIISRVAAGFNDVLASEGGHVKITLTPPALGTLEMDVMVRNNTVKIMLLADNKDVQQMLSGNLDSLKGSLQSHGLTIERCDVMMQDRREQYQQGFSQQAFNQDRKSGGNNDDRRENYNGDIKTTGSLTTVINAPRHVISSVDKISLFV
jgi:hypothetical protein